jgi:hypothetical protein
MLAGQLPLPLVHAHSDSSESNVLLQQHVERHHHDHATSGRQETQSTEDLHWHWVMPWEFTDVDNPSLPKTPNDSTTALSLLNGHVSGTSLTAVLKQLDEDSLIQYRELSNPSLKRADQVANQSGSSIRGHWLAVLKASGHSLQSLVGIAHC